MGDTPTQYASIIGCSVHLCGDGILVNARATFRVAPPCVDFLLEFHLLLDVWSLGGIIPREYCGKHSDLAMQLGLHFRGC